MATWFFVVVKSESARPLVIESPWPLVRESPWRLLFIFVALVCFLVYRQENSPLARRVYEQG